MSRALEKLSHDLYSSSAHFFSSCPKTAEVWQSIECQVVRPKSIFVSKRKREMMTTTRRTRVQTLFYNPSATSQNTGVSARGKLWNPSTRRWINDTSSNRARISQTSPTIATRIRNPRTGRLIRLGQPPYADGFRHYAGIGFRQKRQLCCHYVRA